MYTTKLIIIAPVLSLFLSCQHGPVGECNYGKEAPVKGEVEITSITVTDEPSKDDVIVSVNGIFKKNFIYSRYDFDKCFTSKKYIVGSKLEGIIIKGTPCPPVYKLADCK